MRRGANARVYPFRVREDPFLERLAWLMDESIQIGPWSIGLDGFLGLIPGLGDVAGAALGTLIIARAMQGGAARSTIIRMVINVAVDSLLGSIPVIGDFFDFAYKSNSRNLRIYRQELGGQREPVKDWAFIILIFAVLLVVVALPIVGLVYLGKILGPYLPTLW